MDVQMMALVSNPDAVRRRSSLLLAIALVLASWPLAADPVPKIGLVLGGGGARGVAHIGVLKVLEEMRIPVSCIAGTSMGALVGGAYAAGLSIDDMTNYIQAIDWNAIFTDDPARTEKPFRAKQDDYQNLFRLELGQRGTRLLVPPGSTAGYKFEFLLREMVQQAGNFPDQDFDRLPIPYRAMATNLENGTSKTFRAGDLVKAMRASMSVPGVISPVEIEGTLYVDGGLLQNVPVAAAREACADVVIAVNVGSSLLPRDELNTALGVSLQMVNVLMEQNVRASIASLGADDVLIQPELGDFSSANFAEGLSLVGKGEAAAREQADALRRFSLSESQYREWQDSVRRRLPAVPDVTDVTVATRSERVSPLVIERELAEVPGIDLRRRPETDFSLENLNDRLEQVYGRGDFERMDYRIIDRQGVRTLEVQGVEKSWGPNYLKFGLGLAADSEQTRFNVSLSHRATWLNSFGAEWRNDVQFGYRDLVASELFQPLSLRAGAFVAPRLELQDEPIVYYIDGRRIGDYRVRHARAHLDTGAQNKYGEFRVGAFAGTLDAEPDFGFVPLAPEFDITQVGYTARFVYDQIDNPRFAREGMLVVLDSFGTVSDWGSDDQYNKTSLLLKGAKRFGPHAVELAGWYGLGIKGDLPAYDPFLLGGFLQGSGYRMDELAGDEVALLRGVYSYELSSLPAPIGRGVYFGASLEATRATLGIDTGAPKEFRPSASLFLAADTFLGPAFLGWGQSLDDDGEGQLYFMLGNP